MRKSGVTLTRREPDKALFQEVEGYNAVFVDVSCAPGLAPASRDAVDSVTLNVAGGAGQVGVWGGGLPGFKGKKKLRGEKRLFFCEKTFGQGQEGMPFGS